MQTLSTPKRTRICDIAFSPNGEHLAAACGDGSVRIWELASGNVVRSAAFGQGGYSSSAPIHSIAYLGDNRLILGGVNDWDLRADKLTPIGDGLGGEIRISPNGRYLAVVGPKAHLELGIVLRETATWGPLPPTEQSGHATGGLAFSPSGRWLVTAHVQTVGQKVRHDTYRGRYGVNDYEYAVHIREIPSARIVRTLGGWRRRVTNLAFSPDGRFLVGTAGQRLRGWDLDMDREVAHHERGRKHFQGLAFTPDGRLLATVSTDKVVRVWDARTWDEHTTFTWQVGKLLNIAFAPDGLRAAAGSDKGQIVLWDVD